MEKLMKYPCKRCRRVANPRQCENKRCALWSKWFLQRWELIHRWYLKEVDEG